MDTIDLSVLRSLRDWRASGHRAVLATVVRTWGSSPRPIGAMMALREDGVVVGSVSGGCIEDDLIHRYTSAHGAIALPAATPEIVRYGVWAEEAHRFGLPCGGTLELVLEFDPCAQTLMKLVSRLDAGELVRRTLQTNTGQVSLEAADETSTSRFDGQRLSLTLGPGYRMLLIGAGSLAQYLATMATFNGFRVSVCDPRLEYRSAWVMPDVELIDDMPDDAVIGFRPDSRTCVIALSHDPKLDDLALMEALHSPAFYVGAIGSRRNSDARRKRMIEYFGETETTLERLRGPIGVYIGSKTPAEIAVSVMAEVLAMKNGVNARAGVTVAEGKTMAYTI